MSKLQKKLNLIHLITSLIDRICVQYSYKTIQGQTVYEAALIYFQLSLTNQIVTVNYC